MRNKVSIPIKTLQEVYERTGSVNAAGKSLGVSHNYVHENLKKSGYVFPHRKWEELEIDKIREVYSTHFGSVDIKSLAKELNRPYYGVAIKVSRLGLGNYRRMVSEETKTKMRKSLSGIWSRLPHPRGALGIKHSEDTRRKISLSSRAAWDRATNSQLRERADKYRATTRTSQIWIDSRKSENTFSRCKRGRRLDLDDIFMRSSWEANYARYINFCINNKIKFSCGEVPVSWSYENMTFWFDKIKRGVRSYTPDFMITFPSGLVEYHEIKGWMDAKSKTKLMRMKKYHPSIHVVLIDSIFFSGIKKNNLHKLIPYWE